MAHDGHLLAHNAMKELGRSTLEVAGYLSIVQVPATLSKTGPTDQ